VSGIARDGRPDQCTPAGRRGRYPLLVGELIIRRDPCVNGYLTTRLTVNARLESGVRYRFPCLNVRPGGLRHPHPLCAHLLREACRYPPDTESFVNSHTNRYHDSDWCARQFSGIHLHTLAMHAGSVCARRSIRSYDYFVARTNLNRNTNPMPTDAPALWPTTATRPPSCETIIPIGDDWVSDVGYLHHCGVGAFPRPTSVAGFAAELASPHFSEAS